MEFNEGEFVKGASLTVGVRNGTGILFRSKDGELYIL